MENNGSSTREEEMGENHFNNRDLILVPRNRSFRSLDITILRFFHFKITKSIYICLSPRKIYYSTVCPRRLDPFNIITYYLSWVKSSWTYSNSIKTEIVDYTFGTHLMLLITSLSLVATFFKATTIPCSICIYIWRLPKQNNSLLR